MPDHTMKAERRWTSVLPLILLGIFLAAYFAVISYKLISSPRPFIDWDESIYMQVGREMTANKTIIPTWMGQPWLEKPPLVPLIYGVIARLPFQAEISTRIFSLLLSVLALLLTYLWSNKIFKSLKIADFATRILALTVVVALAFNPTFVRRSQEVNTDVWLLIGWTGYLLTYPKFYRSLFFLFIGVFSKSLLGFYPIFIVLGYELWLYLTKEEESIKPKVIYFLKQIGIMSIWYILMLAVFRGVFLEVHFVDHMVRRVTQSIESHFGKRTFYIDIIVEQYGWYLILAGITLIAASVRFIKNRSESKLLMLTFFFLPFFVFLNLTKTKISWYIYPVLPGVALLLVYPLSLLRKNAIITITAIIVCVFMIRQGVFHDKLMSTYYSSRDPKYKVAMHASQDCKNLHMLLDGGTRKMYIDLKKLNLLISTSLTYGNNPAMAYYYGKRIDFDRDVQKFSAKIKNAPKGDCYALDKKDIAATDSAKINMLAKYDWLLLMKKN